MWWGVVPVSLYRCGWEVGVCRVVVWWGVVPVSLYRVWLGGGGV